MFQSVKKQPICGHALTYTMDIEFKRLGGKSMIIEAYAGCGKITFAERYLDLCVEAVGMLHTRM